MNKEEFVKELEKLGIGVDDKILKSLNTYYEMLIDYNSHTNLTRITDEEEVYLKHFYDSLTLIKAVKLNNQTLLDVGTGAGFPGVPIKIANPEINLTLLDSLNKRIIFLNKLVEKLNLAAEIFHNRAEECGKPERSGADRGSADRQAPQARLYALRRHQDGRAGLHHLRLPALCRAAQDLYRLHPHPQSGCVRCLHPGDEEGTPHPHHHRSAGHLRPRPHRGRLPPCCPVRH